MLRLRHGIVVSADPLTVRVRDEDRRAWADVGLVGAVQRGDEVLVNVEALDLGLGSGGFDIVHANLTRGLDDPGTDGPRVMKLNYTSLQHAVIPVEPPLPDGEAPESVRPSRHPPVAACLLHGQLPAVAWAFRRARPGLRLGYVQAAGGALPGTLSRIVGELREGGLLVAHITAGPSYGGEHEAITLHGALHAAAERLGWDAVVIAPGPGILGSATALGHGGMAALDAVHAAGALGMEPILCPRVSDADPRSRHRGPSHHVRAVLELALCPMSIAVPEGDEQIAESIGELAGDRNRVTSAAADLDGYARSGLPRRTMGRDIDEEASFFACGLAAGHLLAESAAAATEDR